MLTEVNYTKKFVGATGSHELQVTANESLFLKNLCVVPSANDVYFTIRVDGVTAYALRVSGFGGNHCPQVPTPATPGLLPFFRDLGFEMGIPIAAGEKLVISSYAETQNFLCIFDRGDAGHFKATDPNGSKSKIKRYINYGTHDTALTAAGWARVNKSVSPSELSAFPWGVTAPAGRKYSLIALVGCPYNDGDDVSADGYNTLLRCQHNTKWIDSSDGSGWPFVVASGTGAIYEASNTIIGPGTIADPEAPLVFNPPLELVSGDELNMDAYVAAGDEVSWAADLLDVAVVLEEVRA